MARKKKKRAPLEPLPKDFLDQIAPAAVKFNTDHYILGSAYHCTLAVRGYPTSTEELALLSHLGEHSGVTLVIYARQVTAAEEQKIIQNAANRSRLERSSTNDMKQSVTAEANLQDVAALVTAMHRNREPLDYCAVYLDLSAKSLEALRGLREEDPGSSSGPRSARTGSCCGRGRAFSPPTPQGQTLSAPSLNGSCPPPQLQTFSPSTTPARPTPTASMWARTSTGLILL